jgi:hypothetical protein
MRLSVCISLAQAAICLAKKNPLYSPLFQATSLFMLFVWLQEGGRAVPLVAAE